MNHFKQSTVQLFVARRSKQLELVAGAEITLKTESFQIEHCVTFCLSQKQTSGVSHTIGDDIKN
jgi:hypothetical protein